MRKLGGTLVTLLLVAAPALTGCGDDEKEGSAATRPAAATTTPAPGNPVPAELAGSWATRLKGTELADLAPAAVREKHLVFTMKFLETGGVDNGPSVFVETDDLDMEAESSVTVSGDRITLDDPACQFAYAVKAEQLNLTSIGNDCPHDGLSSVLTAGPWERATG